MSQEWVYTFVFLAWLLGAAGFVIGLHQMNSPATARQGNRISAAGMAIAVIATIIWLFSLDLLSTTAIAIIVVGLAIVAIDDYLNVQGTPEESISTAIFVVLGAVIGAITFSGSLIASGKLQGTISGKPIAVPGGRITTFALAAVSLIGLVVLVLSAD